MSKKTHSQDSLSNPRPEEEIAAQLAAAENSEWLDKTYNDLIETVTPSIISTAQFVS